MTAAEPLKGTLNEQPPHVDLSVVDRIRVICLTLPGTSEKHSRGDPSFHVHDRRYAFFKFGADTTDLWLGAPAGARESLIESDPARFFRPSDHPVLEGWVGVRLQPPAAIDWEELEFLLRQAHDFIRSKAGAASRPKASRR